MDILLIIAAIAVGTLTIAWILNYGWLRGSMAILARLAWLLPLALAFFPSTKINKVPSTLTVKPIHILVDDSESITSSTQLTQWSDTTLKSMEEQCAAVGCSLKVSRLSQLSSWTKQGYTPMSAVLETWLHATSKEPWVILSDGGDFKPQAPWPTQLAGLGLTDEKKVRGLIISAAEENRSNIWLEDRGEPLFAFEDQPIDLPIDVFREADVLNQQTVQLQIISDDKILAASNATFRKDETSLRVRIPLQALSKGRHLLEIKALPSADESFFWDNEIRKEVEVLPNTIGVLHLLGSPSWDGRFLRRYLKGEPKYDLVSFFILRDPGDMQVVDERELSLIPFPVDRLFRTELPNFHIVILQNFALYQFLEPNYQKHLVDFVKNGGTLLFLGGPRALQAGDFNATAMSSILPFTLKKTNSTSRPSFPFNLDRLRGGSGPLYQPKVGFKIEIADASEDTDKIEDLSEDFRRLTPVFENLDSFRGLHNLEKVTFKKEHHIPLLQARKSDNSTVPLAMASYPGDGRAIWIFTDSIYKLAVDGTFGHARANYQKFFDGIFEWLLRKEVRSPLTLRKFEMEAVDRQTLQWKANVVGRAARYLADSETWKAQICGLVVPNRDILITGIDHRNLILKGSLDRDSAPNKNCSLRISGRLPTLGTFDVAANGTMIELVKDRELKNVPEKLMALAKTTGGQYTAGKDSNALAIKKFLRENSSNFGLTLPNNYRSELEHYWMLDQWWFYILMLALPLEVIIRRWKQLTAVGRKKASPSTP